MRQDTSCECIDRSGAEGHGWVAGQLEIAKAASADPAMQWPDRLPVEYCQYCGVLRVAMTDEPPEAADA